MTHTPGDKKQRKERVLHTRIPTVLENELKQLAENLRVPVSNLVRTILQDALHAAEEVGRAAEEELRDATERLARERDRLDDLAARTGENLKERVSRTVPDLERVDPPAPAPAPDPEPEPEAEPDPEPEAEPEANPFDGIIGFQELTLAVEARCAGCQRTLEVGQPAYLGVRDAPGPRILIGKECLPGPKESA